MKTTILSAFLMICIVAGIVFWVDRNGPGSDAEIIIDARTQSIPEITNTSDIIYCPFSYELLNGQKPTFSYRDENTGHPLQENMQAIQVAAGINNGKAVCKYFSTQPDKVFSIMLPGNYSSCTYENDAYVGFNCS